MPNATSRYTKPGSRRLLLPEEKAVFRAMLLDHFPDLDSVLEISEVEEMLDGGMGSIRFIDEHILQRHLGRTLRQAEYRDADGTLVLISIDSDQNGKLFELDFWKVDFSPLCRYPNPAELRILQIDQ